MNVQPSSPRQRDLSAYGSFSIRCRRSGRVFEAYNHLLVSRAGVPACVTAHDGETWPEHAAALELLYEGVDAAAQGKLEGLQMQARQQLGWGAGEPPEKALAHRAAWLGLDKLQPSPAGLSFLGLPMRAPRPGPPASESAPPDAGKAGQGAGPAAGMRALAGRQPGMAVVDAWTLVRLHLQDPRRPELTGKAQDLKQACPIWIMPEPAQGAAAGLLAFMAGQRLVTLDQALEAWAACEAMLQEGCWFVDVQDALAAALALRLDAQAVQGAMLARAFGIHHVTDDPALKAGLPECHDVQLLDDLHPHGLEALAGGAGPEPDWLGRPPAPMPPWKMAAGASVAMTPETILAAVMDPESEAARAVDQDSKWVTPSSCRQDVARQLRLLAQQGKVSGERALFALGDAVRLVEGREAELDMAEAIKGAAARGSG